MSTFTFSTQDHVLAQILTKVIGAHYDAAQERHDELRGVPASPVARAPADVAVAAPVTQAVPPPAAADVVPPPPPAAVAPPPAAASPVNPPASTGASSSQLVAAFGGYNKKNGVEAGKARLLQFFEHHQLALGAAGKPSIPGVPEALYGTFLSWFA